MNWDPIWEQIYQARDWGKYPPEDLIRFIARNFFYVKDRKQVKILEIGSGMGANLWFFAREGFDAYGIDASETAIKKARNYLQNDNLSADMKVGDIIRLTDYYPESTFDAVVDIWCLYANRMSHVKCIVEQIWKVLKPGGKIYSQLLDVETYGYGLGDEIETGTYTNMREGPLKNRGVSHYFSFDEIQNLFGNFTSLEVEYCLYTIDKRQHLVKFWMVTGTK